MIPRCKGCIAEFEVACEYVEKGFHVATSKDKPRSYIQNKSHFCVMLVRDSGKIYLQ